MITQIKFCLKHRLKVKGSATLRFQPGVNVLIGPNGSGKSTVLRALHSCDECHIENPNSSPTLYFNPETMNPHHPLIMRNTNIIELVPSYADYLHQAFCQPISTKE